MVEILTGILAGLAGAFLPAYLHNAPRINPYIRFGNKDEAIRSLRLQLAQARQKGESTDELKAELAGWQTRIIPEEIIYLPLLVGAVCALVAFGQGPWVLFSAAGRAATAESGTLPIIIGFTIGFKGYMIPVGTFLALRRLWRKLRGQTVTPAEPEQRLSEPT